MRLAVAEIKQEGNTFTPVEATIRDFETEHVVEGEQVIKRLTDTNTEVWGFIQRASELECDILPVFAASALSGGPIAADAFCYLRDQLLKNLKKAYPIDGIFLALHGAMCANVDGGDDASGLLLREVREAIGPDIPIISTLDLHANVTRQMVEMATALIGYRTWPHIDQAERGHEAAELMVATLRNEVRPVTALSKLRMILQVENGQTSSGPMAELLSLARKWENEGKCICGSVFLVQPWLDLPEMGCAIAIVSDGDIEQAQRLADQLGQKMWDLRHSFDMHLIPIDDAIDRSLKSSGHPIIFADVADSTGSGTPGDSTAILGRILEREISCRVLIPIVDAEAVQAAHQVGIGATLSLSLGGKMDTLHSKPVALEAEVEWLGKGITYTSEGPVFTGLEIKMGTVAVLRVRDTHIVVSERPTWTIDPAMYRAVGLEPVEARIVVVKSQNTFRSPYEGIAYDALVIDAPGLSTANIRSLPFKRLPRPFYPFDEDWQGAPWNT